MSFNGYNYLSVSQETNLNYVERRDEFIGNQITLLIVYHFNLY